ncbi:hypothetical protein H0H92_006028 [Tricholoma furcatifolium]|nr:hypothetical protein H0H92_006028 [Tricholoma furcatifolium]
MTMDYNCAQTPRTDSPSLLTTLKNDIDSVQCDVQRSSPFDRIPTELLSNIIFLSSKGVYYLVSVPHNIKELPWFLGRVCSRWRTLSRADQRLWGPVSIAINRKGRVGGMPLEDIARFFELLPPVASWHFRSHFGNVEPLAPYFNRCELLQFLGDIDAYDKLWRSVPQDAFVNLRFISFQFKPSESDINSALTRTAASEALWASTAGQWAMAHKLDRAEFYMDIFRPKGTPSTLVSSIPLPWHQLKSINVSVSELTGVNCLWVYLRQCRTLTKLTMDILECGHPRLDIRASIDLPDLRNVCIQGRAYLALLPESIWHNLTSLTITSSSNGQAYPKAHEIQKILELCCTNLEGLFIFSLETSESSDGTFPLTTSGQLHFPRLRTLQVSMHAGYSQTWKLNADLIHAPDLRDLEFDGSPSDLLQVVNAFKASLSHVKFSNWSERSKKMTRALRHEILLTLSPTASFVAV